MSRRRRRSGAVFPPEVVWGDGTDPLQVASRFGILHPRRRVLYPLGSPRHLLPGNAVLPAHQGMVITRGLQEVACLLPQGLAVATVARLLGWQTQEEQVLCASTVRTLVRQHGQVLAAAEQAEVTALAARADLATLTPCLVPTTTPRRRASWPPALAAAVERAWASGEVTAPAGVRQTDWERVLASRRAAGLQEAAQGRRLGPGIGSDEVLVSTDEVLTRTPVRRTFWELRTARVATAQGYRYLSGTGDAFLETLRVLILLCRGPDRAVLLLGDGARWIRTFFLTVLAPLTATAMILDWYHLHRKCAETASRLSRTKPSRRYFLGSLIRLFWRGEIDAALAFLEDLRPQVKSEPPLDDFLTYIQTRRDYLPHYRQRRRDRQYIGSGHAEKANDLLVARRQKGAGMHWSEETSVALMRLRTLRLNDEWDRYWLHHLPPSLLAA